MSATTCLVNQDKENSRTLTLPA